MVPHSSTLAWKILWMEEPGRLQSMGSLRVRHDWVTSLSLFTFMNWRRKWQPIPVFLPGDSQGESGGLPSMGSGRVGHDWSDLAAAAAAYSELNKFYCFINDFFFFWSMLRGILVPWPGMEPIPSAVTAQTLNHSTTREFPTNFIHLFVYKFLFLHFICFFSLRWLLLLWSTNSRAHGL